MIELDQDHEPLSGGTISLTRANCLFRDRNPAAANGSCAKSSTVRVCHRADCSAVPVAGTPVLRRTRRSMPARGHHRWGKDWPSTSRRSPWPRMRRWIQLRQQAGAVGITCQVKATRAEEGRKVRVHAPGARSLVANSHSQDLAVSMGDFKLRLEQLAGAAQQSLGSNHLSTNRSGICGLIF